MRSGGGAAEQLAIAVGSGTFRAAMLLEFLFKWPMMSAGRTFCILPTRQQGRHVARKQVNGALQFPTARRYGPVTSTPDRRRRRISGSDARRPRNRPQWRPGAEPPTADLGANVVVFPPDMTQAAIQAKVDSIYTQQVDNEMGTQRYALLFKPGTYGSTANPLDIRVGYYTEVDGLGLDPSGVTINGGVTATGKDGSGALDTFWRSVSNLTVHVVPTSDGCHTGNEMWAVSQAAPMRRVDVKDFTTFMPYCENPNYASGGFVADSRLEGGALNGSQQQFYVRNTDLGTTGWSNGVWNQVFSGDINAPAQAFPSANQYTTLTATPVSREKPYLYVDSAGAYRVFVPK